MQFDPLLGKDCLFVFLPYSLCVVKIEKVKIRVTFPMWKSLGSKYEYTDPSINDPLLKVYEAYEKKSGKEHPAMIRYRKKQNETNPS